MKTHPSSELRVLLSIVKLLFTIKNPQARPHLAFQSHHSGFYIAVNKAWELTQGTKDERTGREVKNKNA